MQRNRFLADMLSTLFDRRKSAHQDDDSRNVFELCDAMLSEEGDVSGHKLAKIILGRYRRMSPEEKGAFFSYLNEDMDVDAASLASIAQAYATEKSTDALKSLTEAAIPTRQKFLNRLNQPVGATAELVAMRVDLLAMIRESPELKRTDLDFSTLLRTWFNSGFLVLKQIDWSAPAFLLDKIIAYEAVHEIDDLDDLRRRLSPSDRRCFAFFHPSMPDEPLIFVEVALTATIPCSIDALLTEDREPLPAEDARVATFYSISNCQIGLQGISFGNLLIKQSVSNIATELPKIQEFVTLSPIPGLRKWLESEADEPVRGELAATILKGEASGAEILELAAYYLLEVKRADDKPVDPVARFHLNNGAEIHDIHPDADQSEKGLSLSRGVMVNYRYDLSRVERNHEEYARSSKVAASKSVQSLIK